MNLKSLFAVAALLLAVLPGCAPRVSKDLRSSIEANKKAKDHAEWELSPQNPATVFRGLREQNKTDAQIPQKTCAELEKFSRQDLSVFEEELKNPANDPILNSCKESLKVKLKGYWIEQQKFLPQNIVLDFKFDTQVENRDLSLGYRAKTADVAAKELILTFDDGPNAEYTPQILDILKAVDAQVMFFPIGHNVNLHPELTNREGIEGHRIGSHSLGEHPYIANIDSHLCLASSAVCAKANGGRALSFEEAKEEIRGGHEAVFNAAGFVDPFFRFPFGESDPALSKFLADSQIGQFYWNIDSGDWKNRSSEEALRDVLAQVETQQKGVILFHDVHHRTLQILPAFLKAIHDRGFKLVVIHPADQQARFHSMLLTTPPSGF